ncbi:glycoside hydrolase family 73 protein [Latilactobacillus fuchuensis]|nr:glucosaminidase domain-containing protein [Latilactobacillus fuchuensis]MCP8857058.1 glucosaminidase domain-containing protein [Latilactobacillus fuchuensis]SPC37593.1 putative N-acetylmuramoyl-L-alanine amidase (Cell wall hydrolase) [Latilactobacillus fuchuensis]
MTIKQHHYVLLVPIIACLLLTGCFKKTATPTKRTWETPTEETQRQDRFIQKIGTSAKTVYQTQQQVLPSIVIAQAIIESDWGRSDLAVKAHNLFGVKGDYQGQKILMTTDEYENEERVTIKDYFKSYPSLQIAIEDHSQFLSVGSYSTLKQQTDYQTQAQTLQQAGYATDPDYAAKLVRTIQIYKLAKYDS